MDQKIKHSPFSSGIIIDMCRHARGWAQPPSRHRWAQPPGLNWP